jgi:hypothetical protein
MARAGGFHRRVARAGDAALTLAAASLTRLYRGCYLETHADGGLELG